MFSHSAFLALCLLPGIYALTNYSIDDQDPSIVYTPKTSWAMTVPGNLDAGGAHMVTQDPLAYATFTFTGVAVYISSSLFPYGVSTNVSLDGQTPTTLNLTDPNATDQGGGPASASSRIVGSFLNLEDQQHKLKVTVPSGGRFAIVDMFIYTSASGSPASTTTAKKSKATGKTRGLIVGLGTVGGLLALALVIVGCLVLKRRRREERRPYHYHNPSDTPDLYREGRITTRRDPSNNDGSEVPVTPSFPSNSSRSPLMNTFFSRPITYASESTRGSGSTNHYSNSSKPISKNKPLPPVDSFGVSRKGNRNLTPLSDGSDASSSRMSEVVTLGPVVAPKPTEQAASDFEAEDSSMDVDSEVRQSGATWDGYEQRLKFIPIA